MKNVIFFIIICFSLIDCKAQFNTIQKQSNKGYVIIEKKTRVVSIENEEDSLTDSKPFISDEIKEEYRLARKRPPRGKEKKNSQIILTKTIRLEGLTIKDLYQEMLNNKIKHPKIVLAQAILETGWFQSSVCRNKGNLFGLTNPKTGEYYEFNHWKESVKAYKDKVQYKYKGGNYLLWLKQIGYAEDPRYISSLIKILEQHFL